MARVGFRVDASPEIGAGHLMRCLTLAGALLEEGMPSCFICGPLPPALATMVRDHGFELRELVPSKEPAEDAGRTLDALAERDLLWLVVDHYGLDARWERAVKPTARALMAVDDLANRRHDCDLLLDQTLGRQPADYRRWVPASCVSLTGAEFALLRPEFAALRPLALPRRAEVSLRRVLVSMGGADPANATTAVLQALGGLPRSCEVTVVVGAVSRWGAEIAALCRRLPMRVEVRSNVSDMARLMLESDLCIGAAGTTSWERCCLGLPAVIVVLAPNQREVAAALHDAGAAVAIGAPDRIAQELPAALETFAREPDRLRRMSLAAAAVTDGRGAQRVADGMRRRLDTPIH